MNARRGLSQRFWDWVARPAKRLEHMRLEGFSEPEVDGFVLRATLQKTALVLIAWGAAGLAIIAVGGMQHLAGVLLWVVYAFATALYIGANLFAVALHLLVVTRRWIEVRDTAEQRDFGLYPLKVAADAVALIEVTGLLAFVIAIYQKLWPE